MPYVTSPLTAPTDTLARIALAAATLACTAKDRWQALDAWLTARRRAARDHCDLASMSERELKDIGVSRASVDAVAAGLWSRDQY